jgi:hypothetical protein
MGRRKDDGMYYWARKWDESVQRSSNTRSEEREFEHGKSDEISDLSFSFGFRQRETDLIGSSLLLGLLDNECRDSEFYPPEAQC